MRLNPIHTDWFFGVFFSCLHRIIHNSIYCTTSVPDEVWFVRLTRVRNVFTVKDHANCKIFWVDLKKIFLFYFVMKHTAKYTYRFSTLRKLQEPKQRNSESAKKSVAWISFRKILATLVKNVFKRLRQVIELRERQCKINGTLQWWANTWSLIKQDKAGIKIRAPSTMRLRKYGYLKNNDIKKVTWFFNSAPSNTYIALQGHLKR